MVSWGASPIRVLQMWPCRRITTGFIGRLEVNQVWLSKRLGNCSRKHLHGAELCVARGAQWETAFHPELLIQQSKTLKTGGSVASIRRSATSVIAFLNLKSGSNTLSCIYARKCFPHHIHWQKKKKIIILFTFICLFSKTNSSFYSVSITQTCLVCSDIGWWCTH